MQKYPENFNREKEGFDPGKTWLTVLGQTKIVPVKSYNTSAPNNQLRTATCVTPPPKRENGFDNLKKFEKKERGYCVL